MLRVVHVLPSLDIGGAERTLERLLHAGLAEKTDAHVVSLGRDGPMRTAFEASGAGVTWRSGSALGLLGELQKEISRLQPDIVQGWMYHANLAVSALDLVQRGWPQVFWNIRQSLSAPKQDKAKTRAIIRAGALFSRRATGIIYNSHRARDQHQGIGYSAERGVVIPNGFASASHISRGPAGAILRDSLAIPRDATVIAHVGRYHPVKDHHSFLAAATRLASARPQVRFVMAGREVVGGNKRILDSIPIDLRERFSLLGEQDDIATILAASDVFALSSLAEAFPNSLGEAMASACACVATDVGDVAPLLEGAGIVVAPGRPDLLADAMQAFVDDPGLRRRSGLAARCRIQRDYTLEAAVARYIGLYESAAALTRNSR